MEFTENHELPFFDECDLHDLIDAGEDVFKRKVMMTKETYHAWQMMQKIAQREGVSLLIVSAFRSYTYQAKIIANKLAKGLSLNEILKVSALPGFSEHHTGRALDLTTDDEKQVLTQAFENTKAFQWLTQNAHKFNFYLSYSRNNSYGFIYEPWHWCYKS
ncbi:D-alanyl-D-alanine carboxypeptidase family protein [Fastidiosibacter lacustris]|uniref:D-alanyl-D-alanine carboxypeptidase family protein n=1 Tax=Fastidiosibacter lacustris TaxID=2056695 RepID=UPI000E3479B9